MRKLRGLLFAILTFVIVAFPAITSAETDDRVYDRCPPSNGFRYCQDEKAYVKSNCAVDPVRVAKCNTDAAAMNQDETSYCDPTKNYFCYNCAYVLVNETCDTGGVPNEPTGVEGVFGKITLPLQIRNIGEGALGINNFLKTSINLIFLVGAILCLFFVLWGALEYMSAGARKDGAAEARKKITYALIGLIILGMSFFIVRLVGAIVGLDQYFQF